MPRQIQCSGNTCDTLTSHDGNWSTVIHMPETNCSATNGRFITAGADFPSWIRLPAEMPSSVDDASDIDLADLNTGAVDRSGEDRCE